jgi:hypothetical protein
MSKRVAVVIAAVLMAFMTWTLLLVFQADFQAGNTYPVYSSLRKDPLGASVFFESLARIMPSTERNYLPVEQAHWTGRTVFFLGATPSELAPDGILEHTMVEQLARKGNRVILALDGAAFNDQAALDPIAKQWGVKIQRRDTSDQPELSFSEASNWTVLSRNEDGAEVLERRFEPGSVVLASGVRLFTNLSLASSPDLSTLASIAGVSSGVIFDESHFGIVESGSMMGLLRAFHLQGLLFGVLLLGGLVVWKFSFSFPPLPPPVQRQVIEGRRSFSGLVALLQRNVAPKDLAGICWQEWLKGTVRPPSPDRRSRAEQQLQLVSAQPTLALNNIFEILHRRDTH